MKLLCPNCQREITVPDQFAGQQMRCPICTQVFTAPALAGTDPLAAAPVSAPASITPPSPPAPPPPPPPDLPRDDEIYTLEKAATPLSTEQPAVEVFSEPRRREAAPIPPPVSPPPSPPPLVSGDYRHTSTVWISPRVVPWLAPASILLIFILQFFTWVGAFPGGYAVYTQNGWQAAFGGYTIDPVWETKAANFDAKTYAPGADWLLIFYMVLFFPTLILTAAVAALPYLQVKLPEQVANLHPWRWALVMGACLLTFFFLLLQWLVGFGLETKTRSEIAKSLAETRSASKTPEEQKVVDLQEGQRYSQYAFHHTFALRLVILLHLLAIAGAALTFWLERRGPARLLPRFDLRW